MSEDRRRYVQREYMEKIRYKYTGQLLELVLPLAILDIVEIIDDYNNKKQS